MYYKRVNMKKLIIASVFAAVLLSGCSKGPLDTTFDLTNLQTLTDSSSKIHDELPEQESEIVQWAINTLNIGTVESIEKFKEQYGADITYRKIVKLAVDNRKQAVFDEYERLKSIEKDWTDIYNDLSKIKASNISLGTSSEFFTRGKPLVSFDVHNGSKQDLSSIQWEIDLYLDDEQEPYSTYTGIDSYTYGSKKNGLRADETVHRSIAIDTFGFNDNAKKWTDLKAQNAKKKSIAVTVIPTSAKDFSEENLITGNVPKALKAYEAEKNLIVNAEKMIK